MINRIKKLIRGINFKYVVGEVLLIFIGINLAIWFNNWNESMQSNRNKELVIKSVKEEINKNLQELNRALKVNLQTAEAFSAFRVYYGQSSDELLTTPDQLQILLKKYPSFFRVKDSILMEGTQFKYLGETFIDLELAELSGIAWKTAQSLDISNEFSYECLYKLESMYNLQANVMSGFDKVANALGEQQDMLKMVRWLSIVDQLGTQLTDDYREVLDSIDHCD